MQESAPAVSVGVSAEKLGKIDAVVEAAIARGDAPGAVVLVGRHGKVVFEKAYGLRAVEPAKEPMTLDTVFDWASLTKVVATSPCVMALAEDGKIHLKDPVAKHLPGFDAGGGGREKIRIEDCLTHEAGFPPDDPLELYHGTPEEIFARKYQLKLSRSPGEKFVYSDVGFEYLGRIVERLSGKPLDAFTKERVLDPLGMKDTGFRRIGAPALPPVDKIAPTEPADEAMLRGIVHDPRARALGGVAGHAGLFGTARDLAKYGFAILAGGGGVLRRESVLAMAAPRNCGDRNYRGLGWDISTSYSGARGDLFEFGSFGHTGFTGTSIWIDPRTGSIVILLTSALHPDGKGNVLALRGKVATIAAAAVESGDPNEGSEWLGQGLPGYFRENPRTRVEARFPVNERATRPADPARLKMVLSGADVLEARSFAPIVNKTVGLLTNQTGFTRGGLSTIDLLLSSKAKEAGVKVVTLFSPEHGIRGNLDTNVLSDVDARTGLPIYSLYNENRRRPPMSKLTNIDALVIDLQDVGCRFYTYLATVGYCLEECAKAGVEVVVLDRPDPIGADRFEGPLLDEGKSAFVGYHQIPIRTGMTIGECARMFNEERGIGAKLTVLPLEGYARDLWYEETGLPWIGPSPNIRSVDAAALYPGVCLLEFTNISVGRGTDHPFEWIGAPWMDGAAVARALSARAIPGVAISPCDDEPKSSAFAGLACHGVRITITDRRALRPVTLGFEIACALRDLHPKDWDRKRFPELLGNAATLALFERGAAPAAIESSWSAGLAEFAERRARFLLYGDPNKKPK